MKMKKNMMENNKKCTCSAIQQCEMHRKPRVQQADAINDSKQSIRNETENKKPIKKEGKK